MKIIIYQTDTNVPFQDLSERIGGDFKKVFFSNKRSFKDEKSQVKAIFPNIGESEGYVFFIPENWKEEFRALLKEKYAYVNIEWSENSSPPKPLKEEIGSGWSEELAAFYDHQMEVTAFWSGKAKEIPVAGEPEEEREKESVRLLDTFLPFTTPIIILLFFMVWFKPTILDVYRGQMPDMLKKADQSLESNIEETSYWAKDRILKIYRQDYPNAGEDPDKNNISEAKALVEAVTEVESAINKLSVTPPISKKSTKIDQRESATKKIIMNPQEQKHYTLQIAHMSTDDLEEWLGKLSDEILEMVFVYKVEDNEEWKVTYGKFNDETGKQGDILPKEQAILKECCKFTKFSYRKTISGLFWSFPQDFPDKNKVGLVELINNVNSTEINSQEKGLYTPKYKFVYTCQFLDLKNC